MNNLNLERTVMDLQEGDQPWGNPKFYQDDIRVPFAPFEWRIDNDPDGDLDPEVMASPLADPDGELLEGQWQFVTGAWGYKPSSNRESVHYNWTSKPVESPTVGDLIDKVDVYLEETADFHSFIEEIVVNQDEKLIYISLGS